METLLTKSEKIKMVFEKLMVYLIPKEIKRQTETYWATDNKRHTYTIIKAECNFINSKNINLPFEDILLEVNEENILILGENFEYNFAPDQILTIWKRIKKTLNN